jgi:hypothetical protein
MRDRLDHEAKQLQGRMEADSKEVKERLERDNAERQREAEELREGDKEGWDNLKVTEP